MTTATTATMATGTRTTKTVGAESELRAAARRRGLTMKELAALMGVSAGYLSQIANGGRPWTPKMREKVAAVLGEVPGQGTVYRQGGVVNGESSFIRERARTLGMTMKDLADRVGVSYSYMTQVAPRPPEHGRQGPGPSRVGAECPGEDRARAVRQPPGERRERRVQLHPGARPRPRHDPGGAGRPRGRLPQLHVDGGAGS